MRKALIIQSKGVEDVLLSSVMAENLKILFPQISIHFFCAESAQPVLDNNPFIDKVISFKENRLRGLTDLSLYANRIRDEKYDLVLDAASGMKSRFLTLKSGAERRIGYDKPFFKYIYTDLVKKAESSNYYYSALNDRLRLLEPFQDKKENQKRFQPEIFYTQKDREEGREILKNAGVDFTRPTIVMGIAGDSKESTWPEEDMLELIQHVQKCYDFNILLCFSPKQKSRADVLIRELPSMEKVYSGVMWTDLKESIKILTCCDAFIGNEGEISSVARGVGLPAFNIYSPFKFPDNWGKTKSGCKNMSVHFRDIDYKAAENTSLRTLQKKSQFYYKKLPFEYVRGETDKFLQLNFGEVELPLELKIDFPKISALLITYNEERHIEKFLEEAWYADEIIVVDSESTDKTRELAVKNPKVTFITRKFNNFTDQKNFAIEKANNEWITFYDADERIPRALVNEMIEEIQKDEADTFYVYRKFYFVDKHIKFSGWHNDRAVRLFKKSKNRYGNDRLVHEQIISQGRIKYLKNRLDHYSYHSVEEYERKLAQYSHLRARELFARGLKPNLFHYLIKPWYRFVSHYFIRFGFLDGREGYIISRLLAHSVFKRYLFLNKMWENEKNRKSGTKKKKKTTNKITKNKSETIK